MRITIFSDTFYPEISGVSDSIASLARELDERGHAIHFYVPRYSRNDYERGNAAAENPPLGRTVGFTRFFSLPYPTPTGQGRAVIPIGLRFLAVRRFNPDVIHTQLFFGAGIEALIAAKVLKVPLVGTNHTALKEFLKYSPVRAPWAERLALRYVNWYYGQCAMTTAPSRSVTEEMESLGFRGASRVIPNPIDTETFSPLRERERETLREKLHFPEHTVIHAGRLGAERSVEVIIKAIAMVKEKVPDALLAIAGRGVHEEKLKELAVSLGVGRSVRFLGFLNHAALAESYNASAVFAITSTADTQSLVMMQALSCGIPVIGVNARGIPEYVRPEHGFLIPPNNPEALAEKIIALFTHPRARQTLGRSARTFAEQFSAGRIAEEWEMLYKKVIETYGKKRREA